MHTLGTMAKALNRSALVLHGIQARFDLPTFAGAGYSDAYLAFLRRVITLRILGISEEALRELWELEKKLLHLLHVDSTGSPTWFLDACGPATHRRRRLLLTNHDMGVALPGQAVQLGLNFAETLPELFTGPEMGDDALSVLGEYLKSHARIRADIRDEIPLVLSAAQWAELMVPTSRAAPK